MKRSAPACLVAVLGALLATAPAAAQCQALPPTGDPCPVGWSPQCFGCCGIECFPDGFELPECAYNCPPCPILIGQPLADGHGAGACADCLGPCLVTGTIEARCLDAATTTCILELGTSGTLLDGMTPCPTGDPEASAPAICPTTTAGYEVLSASPLCIRITAPGRLDLYAITPSSGGFSPCLCPVYWDTTSYQIPEVCTGDVNCDGAVEFADLLLILANYGPCSVSPLVCDTCCPGDVDGDGEVGFSDVLAVLADWGACDKLGLQVTSMSQATTAP